MGKHVRQQTPPMILDVEWTRIPAPSGCPDEAMPNACRYSILEHSFSPYPVSHRNTFHKVLVLVSSVAEKSKLVARPSSVLSHSEGQSDTRSTRMLMLDRLIPHKECKAPAWFHVVLMNFALTRTRNRTLLVFSHGCGIRRIIAVSVSLESF